MAIASDPLSGCPGDWLEMYSLDDDNLQRRCGEATPSDLVLYAVTRVVVVFRSNSGGSSNGFSLNYTAEDTCMEKID